MIPMNNHTPPPWYITEDDCVTDKDGNIIAKVYSDKERSQPADTTLIAAAPELLRLLEVMFDAYENGIPCYDAPDYDIFIGHAFRLDEKDFHTIADLLTSLKHINKATQIT